MEANHLDNGGELVKSVTDVLFWDLVGNIVHVDRERFLRPAGNRDLK